MNFFGEEVGLDAMLAGCDMASVSQRGYGHIYKTMKGRVTLVDKDLKIDFMPKPHKVCVNIFFVVNLLNRITPFGSNTYELIC